MSFSVQNTLTGLKASSVLVPSAGQHGTYWVEVSGSFTCT